MSIDSRIESLEELIEEKELELQELKEQLDRLYIMQMNIWHKETDYQNKEYFQNRL